MQIQIIEHFPSNNILFALLCSRYSVQPNPIDGIDGQYLAGPPDGSRPGTFQVNVFHPEKS